MVATLVIPTAFASLSACHADLANNNGVATHTHTLMSLAPYLPAVLPGSCDTTPAATRQYGCSSETAAMRYWPSVEYVTWVQYTDSIEYSSDAGLRQYWYSSEVGSPTLRQGSTLVTTTANTHTHRDQQHHRTICVCCRAAACNQYAHCPTSLMTRKVCVCVVGHSSLMGSNAGSARGSADASLNTVCGQCCASVGPV